MIRVKNFMKKNIIRTVCLFLICLLGCGKTENNEEPICGGVTDNTDYSASKTINSNNLENFSVGFYHEDKYDSSKGSFYTFILENDSEGRIILKDSDDSEGFEVDNSVLDGVQTIIKKYDLANKNGEDKTTAGLPPEYEACVFKAVYDSKETIYFRENSDPSSEWGREIIDYFAEYFAKNGEDKYLTPKINGVIKCFNLEIQKDNILYQYNTDSDNQIYRCIYDTSKNEEIDEKYVDSCPEYYEGILKIVSDMEIRDFENYDSASDIVDGDLPKPYYDFYIEFENGDIMSGASADPEVLSKFMPMGTELTDYIDNYINSQSEDENAP